MDRRAADANALTAVYEPLASLHDAGQLAATADAADPMTAIPDDDALTPWSALTDVHAVRVAPLGRSINAELVVPGSKSVSNRALILAGMSEGTTVLTGVLRSDDTYWCIDALKRLGASVGVSDTRVTIAGIGRRRPQTKGTVHVGSAGTIARFLPPFLAAGEAGEWRVTASKQMSKRPVAPLFDALTQGGGRIAFEGVAGGFPAVISGNSFAGGALTMSGAVSSQFISGILLGAPQSRLGVDLDVAGGIVQSDYVRITLDAMAHFGGEATADADFTRFAVKPTGYAAKDLAVEADASTATYFAALAAVTKGRITLLNLAPGTRQPDYGFMAILERLGATVTRLSDRTIIACDGPLRGGFTVDMRPLSDATLTLAAIAPFTDGPITMTGVAHIRHHESDRIGVMCRSLTELGIQVEEHADGLTVHPGKPRFAVLETHEDHRVAMSLAVLGAAAQGVDLLGPGCVSKTCPTFFDLIATLGVGVERVAPGAYTKSHKS
jgi:3-phosphoshikimate 1-carboxyvinyltransferase